MSNMYPFTTPVTASAGGQRQSNGPMFIPNSLINSPPPNASQLQTNNLIPALYPQNSLSTMLLLDQYLLASQQSLPTQHSLPYAMNGVFPSLYGNAANQNSLYSTLQVLQQSSILITNVAYMNEKGQLLETLPICRDFKAGKCHRGSECRYVHLVNENVEINQGRVTVCRDAAKGRCIRQPCKYFHIPMAAISASKSLAIANAQQQNSIPPNPPYNMASSHLNAATPQAKSQCNSF